MDEEKYTKKNHSKEIFHANNYINDQKDKVKNSKYRLRYHFSSPIGWINDPNGFSFFNGEYHLFYQFYPYDTEWGPMHWGHAISKDLIHWENVSVALAPSEEYDYSSNARGHGCFSGSAIEHEGKLYLIYTGNVDGKVINQTQNIAISKDGFKFEKSEMNPVIDAIPKEASRDFRDPKVWKHKDMFYLVIGTKKDGKGKIALYSSIDLINWDFISIPLESQDGQGDMWECPDLFSLDNSDILIVSPMLGESNCNPIFIKGILDYQTGKFQVEESGTLDFGNDFYAPQTMIDNRGRRIMIAWMDKWKTIMPSQKDGWAGAMTFPRELKMINGKLIQIPVEEIESIRVPLGEYSNLIINNEANFEKELSVTTDIVMNIDLEKTTASTFRIYVKSSSEKDQHTEITFDLLNEKVIIDRTYSGEGEVSSSKAPLDLDINILDIRILLDTNSLEVFINNGLTVITNRIYADTMNNHFFIETDKMIFIDRLEIYDLNV